MLPHRLPLGRHAGRERLYSERQKYPMQTNAAQLKNSFEIAEFRNRGGLHGTAARGGWLYQKRLLVFRAVLTESLNEA